MYVAPSSHKRRRPSARADAARKRLPGRVILNVAGFRNEDSQGGTLTSHNASVKGKGRADPDADAQRRVEEVIASHCFNHRMTLLVPEEQADASSQSSASIKNLSDQISGLFSHRKSYHVRTSLKLFLNQAFLNAYIRSPPNLIALSVGKLDTDDVICLTGDGNLLLHLTKDTYQTLGLQGRPARFSRGSSGRAGERTSGGATRYLVLIPLLDPTFVPGKPGFQRVMDAFERWETLRGGGDTEKGRFHILLTTSSMGRIRFPDELLKRGDVDCYTPSTAQVTREDVWIPDLGVEGDGVGRVDLGWTEGIVQQHITPQDMNWAPWALHCEELVGWMRLLSRDAEGVKTYYRPPELPISSYEAPEPHYAGRVRMLTIDGFLHPEMLSKALAIVKTWVDGQQDDTDAERHPSNAKREKPDPRQDQQRRWAHLCTSGFSSSPVKWRSHDPGWGIALGQGRSYEDEQLSSRSQGVGKGGKGIFDAPTKGQEKMNRFNKLQREAEHREDGLMLEGQEGDSEDVDVSDSVEDKEDDVDDDGEDDGNSDADSESASSSDDSYPSEDDMGFDAFNQPSKRSAPRTGKQARRKRAKQVKRRGHLRKGHAEREGAVGGSGSEEGWGLILFGRRSRDRGQEVAREQRQGQSHTEQSAAATAAVTATARVIWWENVEGDTRS
ncbi:hypothetical protein BCV69DRAFT_313137 [Microstroma glucosiphilum]|uniref:Uncharacterized protein n=1 Tax=Pseudomicrostroma glucosiphilum TaxID=1684307 RepID=A0A316U3S3_9BASI|nr:hypothetical protein BCV69DRAFT_313137 [Pseudomicrostroma glucosiphilum]PWN19929.1 hypothetical protein BCV69DRAFT_313137 [Pseudomicrostroma glucosiphilum]